MARHALRAAGRRPRRGPSPARASRGDTIQPPSQRPTTIVRTGAGDSQVKWNVPAAQLGAQDRVADHEAGDGDEQREQPDVGHRGEGLVGGLVAEPGEEPEAARRPTHGRASVHHRRTGRQARKRVAEHRPTAPVAGSCVIGPAPGTCSRGSRRAAGPRRGGRPSDRARRGRATARSPRPGGRHDDARRRRRRRRRRRPARAAPRPALGRRGAHQHAAGPVGHGVADGAVVAGRRQPAPQQHDLPFGQAFDLVEDVRADDHACDPRRPSWRNRAMRWARWTGRRR